MDFREQAAAHDGGPLGFGKRSQLSLLGPVDPSFPALSGRLKFTVRRHKLNKDALSAGDLIFMCERPTMVVVQRASRASCAQRQTAPRTCVVVHLSATLST